MIRSYRCPDTNSLGKATTHAISSNSRAAKHPDGCFNAIFADPPYFLSNSGHGLNHYSGPMWNAWQKQSIK